MIIIVTILNKSIEISNKIDLLNIKLNVCIKATPCIEKNEMNYFYYASIQYLASI